MKYFLWSFSLSADSRRAVVSFWRMNVQAGMLVHMCQIFMYLSVEYHTVKFHVLTLKAPRKTASENVVCLCHLLNILADFSNLFLHTGKQCGP